MSVMRVILTVLLILNAGLVCAHPGHAMDDKAIFSIVDQVSTVELMAGSVAERRISSPEIKSLSAQLLRERKKIQDGMRALLLRLDVVGVGDFSERIGEYGAVLSRLEECEQSEFDREYLVYELAFQKRVLGALKNGMVEKISSPEFMAYMVNVVSIYEALLAETESQHRGL